MRGDHVLIRTPEGIEFSFQLAGPVTRLLAFLVDFAVIAACGTVIGYVVAIFRLISPDFADAATTALYFAVSLLYGIVTEWLWRGQTIGKRLLHLRVVDANGLRLHPTQVVVRNLLRAVDLLPGFYLVGGVCCVLNARGQRLGDVAAGTMVVRTDSVDSPDVTQIEVPKYNSLAEYRPLAARLRSKTPAAAAFIALEALLRRDELQPHARLSLFEEFARYFRGLASFPPEATEQLADEQYVRNVVDVIFRSSSAGTLGLPGGAKASTTTLR